MRVALPMRTSSRPVAHGSTVPACPTRRPRCSRRTAATTSWGVLPAGLSMRRMPSVTPPGSPPRAARGYAALTREQPAPPTARVGPDEEVRDDSRARSATVPILGHHAARIAGLRRLEHRELDREPIKSFLERG